MISINTFRGKWRFTQRECSNAIAILTAIENLSKDETVGRIKVKDLVSEVEKIAPDCNVSNGMLWQLAYCGFLRISKCLQNRGTFNGMYYTFRLAKTNTFSLKTLKEDVQEYLKYKEGLGDD